MNALLQEKVNFLVMDNLIWRGLAQDNEATANIPCSDLEYALACGGGVDEAESRCGSDNPKREGAGRSAIAEGVAVVQGGGERESVVVLLRCRHLCLCVACGPNHYGCPPCGWAVTASVHLNLSSL